ncbi:MAG: beta-propeller fold lactonase family protein [Myxococcales bacterium]|nr:beta-propeller fold lactonase family protein [Myxococcales bacterium]MCA9617684.1 beta-propeller fold lactonase family protein [Myxococcales bacterium]
MRSSLVFVAAIVLLACSGDDGSTSGTATGTGTGVGGMGSGAGGTGAGSTGVGGAGQGGMPGVPQNQFLFVANQSDATLVSYRIEDDGSLTEESSVDVPAVGPLAVDPSREHLYAATVSPGRVTAFSIDHQSGALTPLGGAVDIGIAPVYLAVHPSDDWLFIASYGDDAVQVHALDAGGAVTATPASSDSPGTNPHSVALHPSGNIFFVPVTNATPESRVAQYFFNPTNGAMAPHGFVNAGQMGPRHPAFHPSLDILYVVNEHADSVTTYAVDVDQGTLSAEDTVSTLPGGMSDPNNTCADIHVTPDGQHLYASNRGDDSLAIFDLDPTTGLPTPQGHVATEAIPREFEVSADGRYVYAAGQSSDRLASYRVESDGSLTPLTVYDVGQQPMWVLAINVDAP